MSVQPSALSGMPEYSDSRVRLTVVLNRVRVPEAVTHAEVVIDDPRSESWLGHPDSSFHEQLLAFYPGTVQVEIKTGTLAGWKTTAVIYRGNAGPILVGEGAFAPDDVHTPLGG